MTKVEMLENFALNLERERMRLGMTQQEMADAVGVSLSSYKMCINCQTQKLDVFALVKLYELTGKFAFEFLGIDDRKTKIVSKLNDLSEQQLMFVHAVVEDERNFRTANADCDDYVTVFIPTGNLEDGMIYDSASTEKVNIAHYRKRYGDSIHYGIKITSNHLHPAYHIGDILLISKTAIRDGDIGLFFNKAEGCMYIRKFHQTNPCVLEPITEYGVPFEVNPNDVDDMNKWVKFGRVVTKMR